MSDYTIKDVYTEYLSGGVVISPPPNNIEFVAASAMGGPEVQKVTISDKQTAKDMFKGGELLKALYERLDAGSQVIYALRMVGSSGAKASATQTDSIKFEALYKGTWWNGIEIDITVNATIVTVDITDPESDEIYSASIDTSHGDGTDDLVEKVNTALNLVVASKDGLGNTPSQESLTLAGGDDGTTLANGDYTDAITYSEDFTDVNWVHFVSAADAGLWSAILTSCENMITSGAGERFALLDLPAFEPADPEHPTTSEISTHLSSIKT